MGGCLEDADESDARSDDENGNSQIHHGDQNKIIKGLQKSSSNKILFQDFM